MFKKLLAVTVIVLGLVFAVPAHAEGEEGYGHDWYHHAHHFKHMPKVIAHGGGSAAFPIWYPELQVAIVTAPMWIGEPNPVCGLFGMKCYYDNVNDTLAKHYPNGTTNPPDQSPTLEF